MPGKLKEQIKDMATIPNGITLARYLATPALARAFKENPAKMWPIVGAVMVSDNVDGFLARLGNKSERLNSMGFRTSRTGRLFDPATDKRTTYKIGRACVETGIIPASLGRFAANQKATAASRAGLSWVRGLDVPVTKAGKRSEFAINLGYGAAVAAESIKDPALQQTVRTLGLVAGAVATGAAATADYGYGQAARQMAQEGDYSHESYPRIAAIGAIGVTAAIVSIARQPPQIEQ